MRQLLAPTEDFIKIIRDELIADVSAGAGAILNVPGSENFAINDWIDVGYEGSETAELTQITAVTATTITATLKLAHKEGEPIIKYRYNKRKFYGATSQNGVYAEITGSGSPVSINVNSPEGTRIEYSGIEGYTYFKSTYYNSTDTIESDINDADAVLADESTRYCSLYAIRSQAGLTNNWNITDGVIETYRKRAESEIDSLLNARYVLPLQNSLGVAEIPFLIENCATLLAAGYFDYKEYGKEGQGVKWLGEARSILKKLQSPGGQQLLGANKQEMQANPNSNGVVSYPNTVDNNNGPVRLFTMNQRF